MCTTGKISADKYICWQLQPFFQLPAVCKQTTVVFVIVIVEQTIEVPEPKPQTLISFTGLWERAVDEQSLPKEYMKYSLGLFSTSDLCCATGQSYHTDFYFFFFQTKYMKSFN